MKKEDKTQSHHVVDVFLKERTVRELCHQKYSFGFITLPSDLVYHPMIAIFKILIQVLHLLGEQKKLKSDIAMQTQA